jgi:uncharacterized protein YdeI (YjbR/CyaY-like superfamily)
MAESPMDANVSDVKTPMIRAADKRCMEEPRWEIVRFKSPADYRSWLGKNYAHSDGIWLRIYKKNSTEASITYAQALDQSFCYGWIDGQKKAYNEDSWLQKFTPRRSKSKWSKINTQHAERLIESGEMTPAGLKAIKAAKVDGRWKAAYDSPGSATPPDDFLTELNKNKKAKAFFETLNKSNVYAIVYRLQTAKKPETRTKRMKMILAMLVMGEKYHP